MCVGPRSHVRLGVVLETYVPLVKLVSPHVTLAASVNYHFLGEINPYVYLIEVNNCIILFEFATSIFISIWY